ncbi:MAG TPA: hypothetical protein VMJ10_30530 [Kofleriaceae bacterium]|nr:hypothetical protein [Kofleriaceae bacterium]
MRFVASIATVVCVGCSFVMSRPPAAPHTDEEPDCNESYARPGFDAALAVGGAILAVGATRNYYDPAGCGTPYQPPCTGVSVTALAGAAVAVGGVVAAALGGRWAGKCRDANDAYDRQLARQDGSDTAEPAGSNCPALDELQSAATDEERIRIISSMHCDTSQFLAPPSQARRQRAHPRDTGAYQAESGFLLGALVATFFDAIVIGKHYNP